MSKKVNSQKETINSLNNLFLKKTDSKKVQKKLNLIGQRILNNTYNEIMLILKNEI